MRKEDLQIGMTVKIKGKYDRTAYFAEVIELGECMFTHRARFIISCSKYSDVLEITKDPSNIGGNAV